MTRSSNRTTKPPSAVLIVKSRLIIPTIERSRRRTKTLPRFGCSKMRRHPRSCFSLRSDKPAFCGADRKEQVDHPDDRAIAAQNENPSAIWLLENEAQSAELFLLVRAEIALLAEQLAEQDR